MRQRDEYALYATVDREPKVVTVVIHLDASNFGNRRAAMVASLDVSLPADVVNSLTPRLISRMESSEAFKNAFAELHKVFQGLENLHASDTCRIIESERHL